MKYLYTAISHLAINNEKFNYDREWKDFVQARPAIGMNSQVSAERLLEIFYSRLCLKLTMSKRGVHLLWRDLALDDNHRLKQLETLPISLSHSKSISISIVGDESILSSMGVDLEPRSREIKPHVQEFIKNDGDIHVSPITKWCLKEAAYKCLSHIPYKLKLRDLRLEAKTVTHMPSQKTCHWETFPVKDHIVAICYQYKE